MIYVKQLTTEERATFGECPVCHAPAGQPCVPSRGDWQAWPLDDMGPGAHVARLVNAPQTVAVNDGD